MAIDGSLLAAAVIAVLSVAVLRVSWQRKTRSTALNVLGWSLGLLACVIAWQAAGAWGVTVVALCAMGAAYVALSYAALTAPVTTEKASHRRAGMLPEGGEPLYLGRRFTTFAIVGIGALAGSIAIAVAARWFASLIGAGEADATVLALFAAPVAYSLLAFFMLMATSRRAQLIWLGASIASALPAVMGSNAL